jgi:hypothetical protein
MACVSQKSLRKEMHRIMANHAPGFYFPKLSLHRSIVKDQPSGFERERFGVVGTYA